MTFSPPVLLFLLALAAVGLWCLYLAAQHFGWFSFCPRIDYEANRVIAQTGQLPWLLTLTMFYRSVAVDAERRVIVISRLLFWSWATTRRISFDELSAVVYHFEEGQLTAALRLRSGEQVHLFYFWGPFDTSGRQAHDDDLIEQLPLDRYDPRPIFPWRLLSIQRDYSERTALEFVNRLQLLTGAPLAA